MVEGLVGKDGIAARRQISAEETCQLCDQRVEELASVQKAEQGPPYFTGRDTRGLVARSARKTLHVEARARAVNHFLKKPAGVAPIAPMTVPSHGTVSLCAGQTGSFGSEQLVGRHVTSNVKVLTRVAGAPGDGAASLTSAVEQELLSRSVELSGRVTVGAYRVQALVLLGKTENGQQSIHVDWTLTDPSGKKLGNVEQYNEIQEGLPDGVWERVARHAARGIVMLIPR